MYHIQPNPQGGYTLYDANRVYNVYPTKAEAAANLARLRVETRLLRAWR